MSPIGPGCVKTQNRNATKNDIFQFDLQVKSACALSDYDLASPFYAFLRFPTLDGNASHQLR
jgi:hypothetical protein